MRYQDPVKIDPLHGRGLLLPGKPGLYPKVAADIRQVS